MGNLSLQQLLVQTKTLSQSSATLDLQTGQAKISLSQLAKEFLVDTIFSLSTGLIFFND